MGGVKIFIQCRTGSSRLPIKALFPFKGSTIIGYLVEQLKAHGFSNESLVLLIPENPENQVLRAYADKMEVHCFAGSEENLFERFQKGLGQFACESVVRLTGDNPLLPPKWIDEYIALHKAGTQIMTTSRKWQNGEIVERKLPKGASIDIMRSSEILDVDTSKLSDAEKEHVIPYFWRQFKDNIKMPDLDVDNRTFISIDTYADYLRLLKNYD